MTFPTNPYQFSHPVWRAGEFFGRRFEIERLRRALRGQRSVQLVGQFRIGKSSLLRYIQEQPGESLDDDHTIFINYDLSRRPRLRDGDDFFGRIWQLMSCALVERGQQQATIASGVDLADPFEFESFLEQWTEIEGYRFIFLLDEFGLVASNEGFSPDFFDNMRYTIPALTYVLAASRSLSEYSHSAVKSSPLWNVLDLVKLRLFDESEPIQELIRIPAERVGLPWPGQAEDFIYRLGGQHPCYIQMAASALFDTYSLNQGRVNYQQAERIFRETATEHFRYLWLKTLDDRDNPERKEQLRMTLLDLVHGRGVDEFLAQDLADRGLAWFDKSQGCWQPVSAGFAEWLRRWSTDKRQQAEAESTSRRLLQTSKELKKGQLLGNQYLILKTVGTTRHSQVTMAWDRELERLVAIKCLRFDEETSDEDVHALRDKLVREALITAELRHPNIGQIYGIIRDPLAIVKEWVEGASLQDILDAGYRFSAFETIALGLALADALGHLHKQGKCHRDIKPSNVILTICSKSIFTPMLIDFDIARASNRDTVSRSPDGSLAFIGTPPYSAPEQFLNPEGAGPQTDMFALGVVLFRLLTHEPPYRLGNMPSLYPNGRFPKPHRFDIPEPLYDILCGLLSEKPGQRLDALSLKTALHGCLEVLRRIY